MKRNFGRRQFLAIPLAATMAIATPALSQPASDYPTKPIELVVAYGAGGSTDTLARIFAQYASERLGQNIVVVNKPGASGQAGWTYLANAEPDGYTIGLINSPSFEANPITHPDAATYYDQVQPLANLVTDPGILAVAADSEYESLEDILQASRENPGTVTVSHEGVGGDDHLAVLQLQREADTEFNMVAFNGNAEATAALLGGHIDAFEGNMSEAAAAIQDGRVRGLALWAADRKDAVPDVPTGEEQGHSLVSAASRGLAVPAGVPQDVYEKLLAATKDILDDEEFQAELANLNMPLDPIYGEAYAEFLEGSQESLRQLWEESPWIEQ